MSRNPEQQLQDRLIEWVRDSPYKDIRRDAVEYIKQMGPSNFVAQLLDDYLANHHQPFDYEIKWPNFTLQLSMRIWFGDDDKQHDVYVLPVDSRYDFQTDELASNRWIRNRGEDLSTHSYASCEQEQKPEKLRLVRSNSSEAVTYCFVPLLRRTGKGSHLVRINDVQRGLRKVLESLIWASESRNIKSVLIMPFGLEAASHEMDDLIWVVWDELRNAGNLSSTSSNQRINGLTIKLSFGLPQVTKSFLKVMINDSEYLRDHIERTTATGDPHFAAPIPMRISKTWIKECKSDYEKAWRSPDIWRKMQQDAPRIAECICTEIQHNGGLKGTTLQKRISQETTDRVLKMLIGRRVVVAYYELVKVRKGDYRSLQIELGYVKDDESDVIGEENAPNEGAFKTYLSELGLFKSALESPYESKALWPEEIEWLTDYAGPPD